MAGRNANGEGSVYRRRDGRWEAAVYRRTVDGTRKRIRRYAATRAEAKALLARAIEQERHGVPAPGRAWTVGDYLAYWLEVVVAPHHPETTYATYESIIRNHLRPGLGASSLERLAPQDVQSFFSRSIAAGTSAGTIRMARNVLRAALNRAMRDELVMRNVARLVELQPVRPKDIEPWTAQEAAAFLQCIQAEPLYPLFLVLLSYGLRRGEILGLCWRDIDRARGLVHVRQQLQYFRKRYSLVSVKTKAGQRSLPLLPNVDVALERHRAVQQHRSLAIGDDGLVFTDPRGEPIRPDRLLPLLRQLCAEHELRPITIHQLRHTTATLLQSVGVPARDAQLILGHAHITTTQQIYQHGDAEQQRAGLERLSGRLLEADGNGPRSRQLLPSTTTPTAPFGDLQRRENERERALATLTFASLAVFADPEAARALELLVTRTRQHVLGRVAVDHSRQTIAL